MKSVASLIVDAQNSKFHHNRHPLLGDGLSNGFQRTLDHIWAIGDFEAHKEQLSFLMKVAVRVISAMY